MTSLDPQIYVPGVWCCAKCQFTLMQSNLNAADGSVTARDQPGDKCPNCDVPLWRVTWQQQAKEMGERAEQEILRFRKAEEVIRALEAQINKPETADFMKGVPLEAAHQRQRWGAEHDAGKAPLDWFWLIGYLAQKAATSAIAGDIEKAKHHMISTAAALANWHLALTGADTRMRPGIAEPTSESGNA